MGKRLEFDPDTVNGNNVYEFDREDNWLDGGPDSQVFRYGDWVLKKYNSRGIDIEKILLYQQATLEIAREFDGTQLKVGLMGKMTLYFLPIYRVFESKKWHQAFAVSQYVGGKKVRNGQYKPFDGELEKLSEQITEITGLSGIELCPHNTKLKKINFGLGIFAQSICTVTDVCKFVTHLGR